jgi:hypothetical protein
MEFEKNGKKQKNRIVAVTLALFILILLFFAGPAAAFTVTITTDENPTEDSPVEITAVINKNTNEVFTDSVTAAITADGTTYTDVDLNCTSSPSTLGGYGYGVQGYSYGTTTEVNGYGYGYGYGYGSGLTDTQGQITCVGTFTPTVAGNHTIQIKNNDYIIGDSEVISVAAAPTTPSGGSSTTTVTTTPTTNDDTEADTTTVTIYEETVTTTYTQEQLTEVLTNMTDDSGNALFTAEEIAVMIENAEEYEFEITTKVEKTTDAQGNETYKTTITTTVVNNTGKDQKDVKVVIEVPKAVSETASKIVSGTIFTVLKDDPILEFTLPLLKAGQTQTITYEVVEDEQPELEGVTFSEPTVRFAEEIVPTDVTGTDDTVVPVDTPITGDETTVPGMDWTPIIIVIVILVIIGAVAYYKKDDIQKMLKK